MSQVARTQLAQTGGCSLAQRGDGGVEMVTLDIGLASGV